ncbi:MAG: hypothetical protein RRC34_05765 [Lentisphaeria bacterium]|nr:hypothetical protein [Lentisphaeria bacterium]
MRVFKAILPFCLVSVSLFAMNRDQLTDALARAAKLERKPYLALRGRVLDQPDVKPLLLVAASDPKLTWRQRLVARIWHEKIDRGADITSLRNLDWSKEPGYKKDWERDITGPVSYIGKNLAPKVLTRKFHLWYYYIELNWKDTREIAIGPQAHSLNWPTGRYPGETAWHSLCLKTLDKSPERFYILNIMSERLGENNWGKIQTMAYNWLLEQKIPEGVPVLLKYFSKRYDDLYKQLQPGECSGVNIDLFVIFREIAAWAGPQQAEVVKEFMNDQKFIKTAYASKYAAISPEQRERERQGKATFLFIDPGLFLEKIRNRPSSEPLTEPPYYLAAGDKDSVWEP